MTTYRQMNKSMECPICGNGLIESEEENKVACQSPNCKFNDLKFDNFIDCYDCKYRYEKYYEIDDVDHYCKKYNKYIFSQMSSILDKIDFMNKDNICFQSLKPEK